MKLSHVDDILHPDERNDHALEGYQTAQVIHLAMGIVLLWNQSAFLMDDKKWSYLEKLVRAIWGTAIAIIVQNCIGDKKEGIAYGDHVEWSSPEIFRLQVEFNVSFATRHFVPVFEVLIGKLKK